MPKKLFIVAALTFSTMFYAQAVLSAGTIHATTAESSWCGNLAVSTKVGVLNAANICQYAKETMPHAFDDCGPFELNGGLLNALVGPGFNCAATHVHSNVTGEDGLDEYKLISDTDGMYVNTDPTTGRVRLK